jgi:glycerol-3-phosphate dehydrogenase
MVALYPQAISLLKARHRLDETSAIHLVDRYGRRAFDVAAYLDHAPHLAKGVVPGAPDLCVELAYQREQEMAVFPADHWLRRTRLGLCHAGELQPCQPFPAEVA